MATLFPLDLRKSRSNGGFLRFPARPRGLRQWWEGRRFERSIKGTESDLTLLKEAQAILIYDRWGRCVFASARVRELLGDRPGHIDFADDAHTILEAEARLLARVSRSETITLRHCPDNGGGEVHLEANLSSVDHPGGSGLAGIVVSLRDVTEQVLLRRELSKAREKEREAVHEKSDVLVRTGKAFRERMSAMLGAADLLLENELTPLQHRQAKYVAQSGHNLLPVIGDLIYFANLEAGKVLPNPRPTNLCAVISDTTDLFQRLAEREGVHLQVKTDSEAPGQMTDGLRLRQILSHLLQHAIERTDKGTVTVSMKAEAEQLEITVQDNGPTTAIEDAERTFQPFGTARDNSPESLSDLSLRLPIARQLAHLLGGTLTISPAPEQGDCICLSLPRNDCEAATTAHPFEDASSVRAPAGGDAPHSRSRVLLVTAGAGKGQSVREELEAFGLEAVIALSVDDAARALEAACVSGNAFDLVVIDCGPEPVETILLAAQLRRAGFGPNQWPILAVLEGDLRDLREMAPSNLVQDIIRKPVIRNDLAAALGRWLPTHIIAEDCAPEGAAAPEGWGKQRSRAIDAVRMAEGRGWLKGPAAAELAETMRRLSIEASSRGEDELGARAAAFERALRSDLGDAVCRALALELLEVA